MNFKTVQVIYLKQYANNKSSMIFSVCVKCWQYFFFKSFLSISPKETIRRLVHQDVGISVLHCMCRSSILYLSSFYKDVRLLYTWINQGRILLESHNEICNECGGVCIFYLIQWNECARCCLRYVYTILELRSYQTWYINKLCNGGWKFFNSRKRH